MSTNGISPSNGVPKNGAGPALTPHELQAGDGVSLSDVFRDKRLVVVGGTGFLGKVWWAFVLYHYPELGHVYLVVREKGGRSAEERFWSEIAESEVLRPLRARYGDGFQDFLRSKVTPIAGDVVLPCCGLSSELRDELRGEIAAVVNAAGVVDFDPPLDEALEVNAFGCQNLVALAQDLGPVPLLHTSTCYVAGARTGHIEETDPREFPFPRADELEPSHWDPDREIAECLDVIEQARHRASDAFRQSRFLDEAKRNLRDAGEPARGQVLEREVHRVKRKFVEARLAETGMERAQFWGFPNTYTYTKSIGEQIVAASGLPFTIVRPSVVESTSRFPFPGWNEGINTSAPLIFILRQGGLQIPGSDNYLDVIPCDMVAAALTLALSELIQGIAKPVYQVGSSDTNPCTMRRFFELTGLYKRTFYKRTGKGGPVLSFLQSHYEGMLLSEEQFTHIGPQAISRTAKRVSSLLGQAGVGPLAAVLKPAAKSVEAFAEQQRRIGKILGVFVPFVAQYHYIFRCDNTRAAYQRISEQDRRRLRYEPENIDWHKWFMEVHVAGLEKWVFPNIEQRINRPRKAPARHTTLPALLDEMAERFELAVALQRTEADGLSRISFRDWRNLALVNAARLVELGVKRGDRVMLAGENHPAWAVAFFAILAAGATVVPLDATTDVQVVENLVRASGARFIFADNKVTERLRPALTQLTFIDLLGTLASDGVGTDRAAELASELPECSSEDVAALIYTSGTTGNPKGVMLSHENLTALVASLSPLFPLRKGDRVLSVLPLHHTFELSCGLLLPLSRGARVVYLDQLNAERLEHTLNTGKITALVGVPALWEMLERRILARVAEHGWLASRAFDIAVELNRTLGKSLGVDVGRALFGPVHEAFGGNLRFLVSGGAALPERTHRLFAGLGMHLAEGYGLTEAAPVLTVALGGPKARAGHVGKPIPGVEIRIDAPNPEGVGEVLARGPNVMLGYADNEEATEATLTPEGWLRTGDLGKLDRHGHLSIVGRAKDTIVASNGENVYPDDVEARLGAVDNVAELAIVGVSDERGGERVACVAVPSADSELSRADRHARAKRSLEQAYSSLPQVMRPALTTLIDTPLPRTSTRKVKRNELSKLVERSIGPKLAVRDSSQDAIQQAVVGAVASIARRNPKQISTQQTLRGDLGFDSLMLLELLVALEARFGEALDADQLGTAETVGEIEQVVRQLRNSRKVSRTQQITREEKETEFKLPPVFREVAMQWLGKTQMGFYDRVLSCQVSGRAYIPHNRNCLVAANHASHLDMGLVKYALGSYGNGLVSLAAQDYFFEGDRFRRAYFENLTNLVPMARNGSLRQALRQAGDLLDAGKTLLIFPEGTRSTTGQVHEFKPAVGHLALHHGVDILPVWLGGTHAALPKGARTLRSRNVVARIGPPLESAELRRLTEGLSMTDASRRVAELAERAVRELSRGKVFRLDEIDPKEFEPNLVLVKDDSLAPVFRELKGRFVAGSVKEPVSYYFSLGDSERWTVRITPNSCEVAPGKVQSPADCVLKTSPDIFTRIVREAYTPSPAEFMSGQVKSNNISLLLTFQKAFQLQGSRS